MAPALTQASDPQTFHVTAHHHSPARPGEAPSSRSSPPPTAHLALQYGGLKEPHDCTDAHLAAALTNGTRRARLLPPSPVGAGGLACGREGCDPPPRPHAAHTTMDPPSGATAPTEDTSQPPNCCESNAMGQDTGQQGTPGQQAPHAADHKAPRPPPQDGDLLALIGRDFANMNEIIDTLTRLADNPEVLAAVDTAALDLHGQCEGVPHQALDPQTQVRQFTKEERAHLLVDELDRRHLQIERRQIRLLRRLRRVTARGLGASVSGQLRELLDHAHGALAKQREHTSASDDGPAPTSAPEVGVEALRADAMRTMSTSALVNLVRRVEASQGLARLAAASHRPPRSRPPTPAPALPERTRAEVAAVSAEVEAAAHAHSHHDSDATESSSGGESCDEGDGYNDTNTHHVPV